MREPAQRMALPCALPGACFARYEGNCRILNKVYKHKCPFQKPKADMTNGIRYPYVSPSERKDNDDNQD